MSTSAVMIVKDEVDIITPIIRHLAYHVDHLIIRDNLSSDGTWESLCSLRDTYGSDFMDLDRDDEVGYWQSRKMTELAQLALNQGYSWVIPCDADECWYVGIDPARRLADFLSGTGPDVQLIRAELYNHIPSSEDKGGDVNPLRRIQWRKRERSPLWKVACRAHESLVIHAGNHHASYIGNALAGYGLVIRHFSWRSPEQYLLKIRNGIEAYSKTDLPEGTGAHWRMWEGASDEAITDHYMRWFQSSVPSADDSLILDPCPYKERRG